MHVYDSMVDHNHKNYEKSRNPEKSHPWWKIHVHAKKNRLKLKTHFLKTCFSKTLTDILSDCQYRGVTLKVRTLSFLMRLKKIKQNGDFCSYRMILHESAQILMYLWRYGTTCQHIVIGYYLYWHTLWLSLHWGR